MSAPTAGRSVAGAGPTVLVRGGRLVFLSGIRPDATGQGIEAQADAALDALERTLAARELGWSHVAKVLVHLTDLRDLDVVLLRLRGRSEHGTQIPTTVVQVDNLPAAGIRLQLDVVAAG